MPGLKTPPRARLRQTALSLLVLLGCVGAAGAAGAPARSLRFEHLGLEQGLPQESVFNVLQDRQGFMWFGGQAGLSRYDGYKMTVFKNLPSDPNSIPDNYVSASYEDADGRLWFGTKGGLTRFDPDRQQFLRYATLGAAPLASNNRTVSAIVGDGGGGLWLASSEGLKHFDPPSGRFQTLRHDPTDTTSLSDNRIQALAMGADGRLWVGTARGLNRLDPASGRFERYSLGEEGSARNSVHALSVAPDRTLWIGTGAGLEAWRIEGATPARRERIEEEGVAGVRVVSLYHDKNANLWVGTELDGLKWRDPASGHFASYRHQPLDRHSLVDNQVSATFVDRTGTLWIGSTFGGASRADVASGGFNRFMHSPGDAASLSGDKVRALAADGEGRLWVGTTGQGLNLFDVSTGKSTIRRHDPHNSASLPDDVITALATNGKRLWVGSPSGLSWMDLRSGRFTRVPLGGDVNAGFIQRLLVDRQGMLWVLTRGGLHRYDQVRGETSSWRHDPGRPDSLGDDHGFALLEDRQGAIWIGTDNGLDRFDRASGRFTHFRYEPSNPAGLRHSRIYFLFESRAGQLWVGSAGGLHRVEQGSDGQIRFRFFPLNGTRAADPIGAVLEDLSGDLWVSSTAGMARLDPVNGQVRIYTSKDGLIDGSYFVGSAAALADGRLNFGGVNGLTSFRPESIRENPYPPTVLITDFLIFNRPVLDGQIIDGRAFDGPIQDAKQITLSHRDSVFSLEFSALHFADPQRNRYAYQLEGFDQGWVNTDASRRFATYTNLDPGNYVFRVRASNKDGVWNEIPTTLAITIAPPFWKTWWARLLAGALALGAAYALYQVRIRALVQQRGRLESLVGSRTAELQLEKESVERQKHEVEHQKDVVELAHRNISLLSEIGRKLTAKLDSESIMLMLYAHVNDLMDASVFGIGVYHSERELIDYPFAIERGKRYTPYSRSMREPNQLAVWCIANEREVFINDLEKEYGHYIRDLSLTSGVEHLGTFDDGSLPIAPQSLLYVPIIVTGRVLGVVTVHSFRKAAYERIHLDMLRTLAAYVGVAFDNADAYRQLKDTQAQLVAQEKLAGLGSLVAGVAHELNTPIGNSLLMASALQAKTEDVARKFEATQLRRSELKVFISESQEASGLIMRSLFSAADLVNSFKQVAVDQASAQRRLFDLDKATHEIVATMMNQVRKSGHTLEIAVPAGIEMDSFPGPYGQVLINLINNALLHAFDGRSNGIMRLEASLAVAGRVQIGFHDNGVGIPADHLARIFDPFFTTKLGQGGSGLGLSITYNIVSSLLEGQIRVESEPGRTTFTLDLPLTVTTQTQS